MRGPWKSLALAAGVVSSFVNHVFAQTNGTGAATYIYMPDKSNPEGNVTFTITVNPANKDLWFRMSAPSEYSWIAVGSGSTMSGSTMFIAYEGSDDKKITLSARQVYSNVEPSFYKDLGLNVAVPPPQDPHPNGIIGETYFIAGRCSNCLDNASISATTKFQNFIFAVGPPAKAPRSDSPSAPLRRHAIYGKFTLDMTAASGQSLPLLGTNEVGVVKHGEVITDRERASSGHALVMCFAFVVAFPIGIVLLRLLDKVNIHMYVQSFGLLLVVIGFASGLVISKSYNRSKDIKNPHQIIGIIVFILVLAQYGLGLAHHIVFKRTQKPTWMIKPHKFGLGALTLGLGIVNGALGFKFALAGAFNIVYVPIVIVMFIVLASSVFVKRFFAGRRRKNITNNTPFGGPAPTYGGQQYGGGAYETAPTYNSGAPPYAGGGYESGGSNIALSNLGAPPSYSQQPQKPREML